MKDTPMNLAPHTRLRRSPYFESTQKAGVSSFSVYNRMLLPANYGNPEAEYWRLLNGAAMWDVAAQRQVELRGPDAAALAQILAPRDLSSMRSGEGKYVPLCDHDGVIINDPVLLKLDEDRFWISIADSDMLLWSRAVAAERRFRVRVSEPDVSPLAVQGPKAEDVIASVFGEQARALKFFGFFETQAAGAPLLLARSGWSRQGGFELYLMDGDRGGMLWDAIAEAGKPWDIGPGCPDPCERIESGLLSWGGDTDSETNPFEVRMEKYVDADSLPDEVIGAAALRDIKKRGPKRRQLGVILEEDSPMPTPASWRRILRDGSPVGHMTCGTWSRRLQKNIGFALVARESAAGDDVHVEREGRSIPGRLSELPFI